MSMRERFSLVAQVTADSAGSVAADSLHSAAGLKTVGLAVWTFLASVIAVEPALGNLFVFLTLLDLLTAPWLHGHFLPVGGLNGEGSRWRRAGASYKRVGSRLIQSAVILAVTLSIAQAFPLFGLLADAGFAWAAGVAGLATLDHVLRRDHAFRLFFVETWQKALRQLGFVTVPGDAPARDGSNEVNDA